MRSDLPALGAALSLALTCGCADPFVEADCGGNLEQVVKGFARGMDVDLESLEVTGGIARERFVLTFPSPLSATRADAGWWLLDLGYNPLGGFETFRTLSQTMGDWWVAGDATRSTFQIGQADIGERCDVERGQMCGGFGVDVNGDGIIDRVNTNGKERYHLAKGGEITFEELRPEAWRATFRVEIDADMDEETLLGGEISGCFRAVLTERQMSEALDPEFRDIFR